MKKTGPGETIPINKNLGTKWDKHFLYYGTLQSERYNIASLAFCETFPDLFQSYLYSKITKA